MAGVLCRVVIKWPLLQWDTRSNNKNNVSVWNINWHNFQIGFPSSRNKILQKKTLVIIYIWCLFETVLAAATFTRFNLIKLVSVKNLWLYLSGFRRVKLVSVWSCRDQPRGEMHQKNVPLFKSSLLQQPVQNYGLCRLRHIFHSENWLQHLFTITRFIKPDPSNEQCLLHVFRFF